MPGDAHDGSIALPAGNFTGDPGIRPRAHVSVATRAPWCAIQDALPRIDACPAGLHAPLLAPRPPRDPPGAPRGSCLCGGAAYILTSPPQRCVNCHCSRCRRARSAAFGSLLFTSVRYTRGEDLLTAYTLPEARRFSYAFCRCCGSPMPRPDAGSVGVQMGSLDDDPGIRPQVHIFVGSKAPWYEISDDLPQYAEFPPAPRASDPVPGTLSAP